MKIILLGNIASGKTTIASNLINYYPDIEYISIDDIRKKNGDGSELSEIYCKNKFIDSVSLDKKIQLLELTGVGVLGEKLFDKISDCKYPILVFYLICDIRTILIRMHSKEIITNFPKSPDNIFNAIFYTDNALNSGLIEKLKYINNRAIFVNLLNSSAVMLGENIKIIKLYIEKYKKI